MSVFSDIEICKLDYTLMAYVKIQNDWTGQVRGRVYTIRRKNGKAYVVADGQRIDVTKELERYEHDRITSETPSSGTKILSFRRLTNEQS